MTKRPPARRSPASRRERSKTLLHGAADGHHKAGRLEAAASGYRQILALDPDDVVALVNLSAILNDSGRPAEAIPLLRHAIERHPDQPSAYFNLANALRATGEKADALAAAEQTLRLKPSHRRARFVRGRLMMDLRRIAEARDAFEAILDEAPESLAACHNLFKMAIGSGEFDAIERSVGHIRRSIPLALPKAKRFAALANIAYDSMFYPLPDDLHAALTGTIDKLITADARPLPPPNPDRDPDRRLRIGYLSPNWGDHPVGHVTHALFAAHDRAAVEVIGLATRSRAGETTGFHKDIRGGFDRYVEIADLAPRVAAERIRAESVDILVDLDGYMELNSPPVLAHRPSPVQVYWLGHAGGLGLSFVDYLIADAVVLPPGEERRYREAIVRMPECYHPANRLPVAMQVPDRASQGLAPGLVFCAFNNPEKIDRRAFALWMRILVAVPGSQLWLSDRRKYADPRPGLRAAAAAAGVDPARLVFSVNIPRKGEHLARHMHADLFLDTPFTLNAATTALDALSVGLPVLTIAGDRFETRIAESYLRTLGLDELIAASPDEYVARAVALARDAAARDALRRTLFQAAMTSPLFDNARFARHLEDAFRAMWRRYAAGGPPVGFDVTARPR